MVLGGTSLLVTLIFSRTVGVVFGWRPGSAQSELDQPQRESVEV